MSYLWQCGSLVWGQDRLCEQSQPHKLGWRCTWLLAKPSVDSPHSHMVVAQICTSLICSSPTTSSCLPSLPCTLQFASRGPSLAGKAWGFNPEFKFPSGSHYPNRACDKLPTIYLLGPYLYGLWPSPKDLVSANPVSKGDRAGNLEFSFMPRDKNVLLQDPFPRTLTLSTEFWERLQRNRRRWEINRYQQHTANLENVSNWSVAKYCWISTTHSFLGI